jgi:UDP-N-acetylmuramate dehydrogenase
VTVEGARVTAGAAALDAAVARRAAEAGVDLTFLRTIPGTIGGAVRMNAGCYGRYVADALVSAEAVTREGERVTLAGRRPALRLPPFGCPRGDSVISATFEAPRATPRRSAARMEEQLARRDATQPTKDRTAGSTFRNPVGHSSTGEAGESHELKAWKVIDDAGLRGARIGGAVMNEKHPNFLTNAGGATAAELEALGEMVREKVFQISGIALEWEIMRVGEPARG